MDVGVHKSLDVARNQVQELAGTMAGLVDDLDCETWAVFSASEAWLLLKQQDEMRHFVHQ